MPIIDGKKFACSTCIKGHRSSACNHHDRELKEILPKGRPPTQCAHCRQLRKTSKVHSRCSCGDRTAAKSGSRPRVIPAGTARPEVGSTCACTQGGSCTCSPSTSGPSTSAPRPTKPSCCGSKSAPIGLGSLLEAAAMVDPIPSFAPSPSSSGTPIPSFEPPSSADSSLTSPSSVSALFTPSTAGTASCFCGPSCPCPGCVVHDPLGRKFDHSPGSDPASAASLPPIACPTGRTAGSTCLGGMDLPTIEQLLSTGLAVDESSSSDRPPSLQKKDGCACCGQDCRCATCACSGDANPLDDPPTLHDGGATASMSATGQDLPSMDLQCTVPSCGLSLEGAPR